MGRDTATAKANYYGPKYSTSQHSTTSVIITVVMFLRKKVKRKAFQSVIFLRTRAKNFKLNLVLVLVLVLNLKLSNVVMAKTSYQMLKKVLWFPGCLFFDNTWKNEIKSILLLVIVLVHVSTSRRDLPLLQLSWLLHPCQTPSHPGELNSESYNCDLQVWIFL